MRPLIVAAPASGSGKSSLVLGLLGALQRRGLTVAPFKVGPDFIDPGHHAAVCGRISRNLDGWMCGREGVLHSFATGSDGADLALIEGVMGLFDGADGASDAGSSAEIARWLGGSVLLVIDARAQARSAAAVAQGLTGFAADLHFAGIVYNRVGSAGHEQLLREAHGSVSGLPPLLGCLPRREALALPERYLGLVTAGDAAAAATYAQLADWVAEHVDLDRLLQTLSSHPRALSPEAAGVNSLRRERPADSRVPGAARPVRIGVARDAAFCFCYPENLECLEQAGARLVFFSPLVDPLPGGLDGLYLPGGYPELHAGKLAANAGLLTSIRTAVAQGLPVYAECGGLLYLTQGLAGEPPAVPRHELVGLFPVRARMLPRRKALGYRTVAMTAATPLGPAGTTARGHEFHYSEVELPEAIPRVYHVTDRAGRSLAPEGFLRGSVLASYIHLHFASNPHLAANFVNRCRQWQAP